MNELLENVASGTKTFGGYVVAALVAIAALLPKLTNGMKADRIDGSLLERLAKMDTKIHKTSVKVTRLVVLVIEQNALLMQNGIVIPDRMKVEMRILTADIMDEKDEGLSG